MLNKHPHKGEGQNSGIVFAGGMIEKERVLF